MTTTKAKWEKEIKQLRNVLKPLPASHGNRRACIGGCGRKVTRPMGECRKCRRARVHKGLKHFKKMSRAKLQETGRK